MSLNLVHLVGRAGRDPELRYFESGSVKCSLTMAVNRPTSKTDEPDWFELEIWGKTAEIAGNYVRKGGLIGVQGSLKIETWSDRNTGANRSKPVIRVDRLDLLGSKKDNENYATTSPNNSGNSGQDEF
jgi:single-strand DNA-binding protein